MVFANLLSLNFLIFLPVLAAIVTASPMFGTNQIYIRRFAKSFSTFHFLYALLFVLFYNYNADIFYDEITISGNGWLSKLGINAAFGADGFTVLLCVFTSLIFLLTFIVSKTMIKTKHKMFYTLMLLLFSNTLGIFCAKDMFLFLMFWQAEIVLMFLLISQWGEINAKNTSMKYAIYHFSGSIFITLAMIGLYYYGYHSNETLSSSIDFLRIYQSDNIFPVLLQKFIFWCFFIGFAVKMPVFPLHRSFVKVQTDAVTPVGIINASVLTATGAYGLIRFNLDLFPEIFAKYSVFIMALAVFSIVWSLLCTFKQKDIKNFISYISIYFSGLFLLGMSALNKDSFNGAFLIIFANILISAGLTLCIGIIQQNFKTKSLQEISGLGNYAPRFMALAYLIVFAVTGLPFTISFPAVFSVLSGVFSYDLSHELLPKIFVLIVLFAVLMATVNILKLFQGIFCKTNNSYNKKYPDISGHRLMTVIVLCFCIFVFGLFPDSIINMYSNVTDMLIDILRI